MTGARQWAATDRTGGTFDEILDSVRDELPSLRVTRLQCDHAFDDDNLYWLRVGSREVQVDTADGGSPPFVIESDSPGSRLETADPQVVSHHLRVLLRASR